jgi:hypothetical protein
MAPIKAASILLELLLFTVPIGKGETPVFPLPSKLFLRNMILYIYR